MSIIVRSCLFFESCKLEVFPIILVLSQVYFRQGSWKYQHQWRRKRRSKGQWMCQAAVKSEVWGWPTCIETVPSMCAQEWPEGFRRQPINSNLIPVAKLFAIPHQQQSNGCDDSVAELLRHPVFSRLQFAWWFLPMRLCTLADCADLCSWICLDDLQRSRERIRQ